MEFLFGNSIINKGIITVVILGSIMIFTVFGNILVILSIFTYRPLHNVQNMFLVSLAVSDITVAVLVMPFNVAYNIIGKWIFGLHLCEMWLTSDVLCCTASILNLCAIALDRYWAIHDPINYAHKRTMKRVLTMIFLVWAISAIISIPPLIGWNDWPDQFNEDTPCKLTEEKSYLIYSSSGSFYIPLIIMTVVYIKIFQATKRRLRDRAKASAMANLVCTTNNKNTVSCEHKIEIESASDDKQEGDKEHKKTITKDISKFSIGPSQIVSDPESHIDQVALVEQDKPQQQHQQSTSDTTSINKSCSIKEKESKENLGLSSVKRFWEEKQKISLSRERRATRILGIVMGVFVACWLPFFLMYIIVPFCEIPLPKEIENFITWLGYINSALNPLIYCGFNRDFRKAFQKLICCKSDIMTRVN